MASSHSLSRSGLWRRPASTSDHRTPGGGPPLPDVDPPPRPRLLLQLLSFGLILFLAGLQLLPATHFRHPADPLRSWIPFNPNRTAATSTNSKPPDGEQSDTILQHDMEAKKIHIFTWSNCLDLQVLAVLAISTLSSSRFPERVHFHFFVPEGEDEKLSYYKLKVLLPHSNLEIIGQKEVKEKLRTLAPEVKTSWPLVHEIVPLLIPRIYPSWSRLIYISPDTIVKGKIEELFAMDLGHYAMALAEDCNRRLTDYVNIDVLNAIQRTNVNPWIPEQPYDDNSCAPDLDVFVIEANKLEKYLLEAVVWWSRALNIRNQSSHIYPAIALSVHNKYLKLSGAWKLSDPMQSKLNDETKVLRFDGPRMLCLGYNERHPQHELGGLWKQYLSPKSEAVLKH